jgi:hypothetical protein
MQQAVFDYLLAENRVLRAQRTEPDDSGSPTTSVPACRERQGPRPPHSRAAEIRPEKRRPWSPGRLTISIGTDFLGQKPEPFPMSPKQGVSFTMVRPGLQLRCARGIPNAEKKCDSPCITRRQLVAVSVHYSAEAICWRSAVRIPMPTMDAVNRACGLLSHSGRRVARRPNGASISDGPTLEI